MRIAYREALRSLHANPCPRQTVIPFNRLETHNWDLLAALASSWDANSLAELRNELRDLTGRQHIFFSPSGRCAIAQVLSLLPQQEVVMPAYTSSTVKTAAEVAGKHIIYVDIERNGVNATSVQYAEAVKPDRILLPTHLFGVPTDIETICELARSRNCVTIEDACSSFGAKRRGCLLGTFADFGIFSFERSKRFPAFHGAAIVVNNDRFFDPAKLGTNLVTQTEQRLPIRELIFALAYNTATIPWLYGRFTLPKLLRRYLPTSVTPDTVKQIKVTLTPSYNREFHPYQAELVLRMLRRLDYIREQIARLTSIYRNAFKNTSIATFLPTECDDAGLSRFPIAFPRKNRAEFLRLALGHGLYLETNYEQLLAEKSEYSRFPNAVWAARNLVLLPLYTALAPRSTERLSKQVIEIETKVPESRSSGESSHPKNDKPVKLSESCPR